MSDKLAEYRCRTCGDTMETDDDMFCCDACKEIYMDDCETVMKAQAADDALGKGDE